MARKTPAEIVAKYCEYGKVDGEAAIAALDKAGYVVITKAERRAAQRAMAKANGSKLSSGTKTGRMSVK